MHMFQPPADGHRTGEAGLRAGVGLAGLILLLLAMLLAHLGGLT